MRVTRRQLPLPVHNGKLLTAEQSVRLALMDSADKEKLIAAIVAGLRDSAQRQQAGGWSPHLFYSQLAARLLD